MKYIKVPTTFIQKSYKLADDLYGWACMQEDSESRGIMKRHLNACLKYLKKAGLSISEEGE